MNGSEILSVLMQNDDALSTQIEFWLTGTFALVITTFLAGTRFSRALKWLLAILYFFFSFIFFVRYSYIALASGWLIVELAKLVPQHPIVTDIAINRVIGISTALLFLIGTSSTIYFLFRSEQLINRNVDADIAGS